MVQTSIQVGLIAWAICAPVGADLPAGIAVAWVPPTPPGNSTGMRDGLSTTAKAAESSAPRFPDWPSVRLAALAGFDDDAARNSLTLARVANLEARVKKETDLPKRVDLQLAAANLILSRQLEPECARRLLHLQDRPGTADGNAYVDALAHADSMLSDADRAFHELDKRTDDLPDGWLSLSRRRYRTLHAFSVGLRAFLVRGDSDTARRAATGLAPLLEHPNRAVAAAASLWQASLRSMGGDPVRALAAVAPALADPSPDAMPYAFFARVLRCRLTAGGGGYAAALSLLMQIEERCDEWFTDDTQRQDAERAAQWTRLQIMADWLAALSGEDRSVERRWCVDRAKALIEEAFAAAETSRLYRLNAAIPIIAPQPVAPAPSADPSPGGR